MTIRNTDNPGIASQDAAVCLAAVGNSVMGASMFYGYTHHHPTG